MGRVKCENAGIVVVDRLRFKTVAAQDSGGGSRRKTQRKHSG